MKHEPAQPGTTDRLSCECCDWAGGEADLKPDHTCPKCGEVVWSDQVILGRTLDDWRHNIPHVGMGNDEALALIDEIERLRGIVVVAKAYAESYLQDEAADRDICISGRQHELAQALRQLVNDYPCPTKPHSEKQKAAPA